MRKTDPLQKCGCDSAVLSGAKRHREKHIFQARIALEQIKALIDAAEGTGPESITFPLAQRGEFGPIDDNGSRIRPNDTSDEIKKRSFPTSALALQPELSRRRHRERVDRDDRFRFSLGSSVRFCESLDRQDWRRSGTGSEDAGRRCRNRTHADEIVGSDNSGRSATRAARSLVSETEYGTAD